MREIKFRAWDKKLYIMFPYEVMTCHKDHYQFGRRAMLSGFLQNPDYEVMQFTGLKDWNGVEIYEGDILSLTFLNSHLNKIYLDVKVEWGDWCYQLIDVKHNRFYSSLDRIKLNSTHAEVTGNVYQNPELLKN